MQDYGQPDRMVCLDHTAVNSRENHCMERNKSLPTFNTGSQDQSSALPTVMNWKERMAQFFGIAAEASDEPATRCRA